MEDCLFCKIIQKKIPSSSVYEDDHYYAFNDIHPQAPIHILIIPKTHIARVYDFSKENIAILGEMILLANKIAIDHHIDQSGYRLVINCNPGAGQSVYHIHLHLIGGRSMKWPPG